MSDPGRLRYRSPSSTWLPGDMVGESCRTDNSRRIDDRKPPVRRGGDEYAEVVSIPVVLWDLLRASPAFSTLIPVSPVPSIALFISWVTSLVSSLLVGYC